MEPRWIYMTAPDADEARRIGRHLLEKRLVACVNIIDNMQALYWWEGEICEEREVVLIAKTDALCVPELIGEVQAEHSYSVPCVLVFSPADGNVGFVEWIAQQTRFGQL